MEPASVRQCWEYHQAVRHSTPRLRHELRVDVQDRACPGMPHQRLSILHVRTGYLEPVANDRRTTSRFTRPIPSFHPAGLRCRTRRLLSRIGLVLDGLKDQIIWVVALHRNPGYRVCRLLRHGGRHCRRGGRWRDRGLNSMTVNRRSISSFRRRIPFLFALRIRQLGFHALLRRSCDLYDDQWLAASRGTVRLIIVPRGG